MWCILKMQTLHYSSASLKVCALCCCYDEEQHSAAAHVLLLDMTTGVAALLQQEVQSFAVGIATCNAQHSNIAIMGALQVFLYLQLTATETVLLSAHPGPA